MASIVPRKYLMRRAVVWLAVTAVLIVAVQIFQIKAEGDSREPVPVLVAARAAGAADQKDDDAAREAFRAVYEVYMHPRCMNCHPTGDAPLQGDDSRPHEQNVKRGPNGHGLYALKCRNCHQKTNLPGEGMPPGNDKWDLPAADMPMVFEGRTPGQLCRQLKNPEMNGGMTLEDLIDHVSEDSLVLWGWNPGDGRTLPPLGHAEFARKMKEWADKGAACPE